MATIMIVEDDRQTNDAVAEYLNVLIGFTQLNEK